MAESSCSSKMHLRLKKLPMRYQTISDSSTESESDQENWERKECGSTNGDASDYVRCDKCENWYQKACTKEIKDINSQLFCHNGV